MADEAFAPALLRVKQLFTARGGSSQGAKELS